MRSRCFFAAVLFGLAAATLLRRRVVRPSSCRPHHRALTAVSRALPAA